MARNTFGVWMVDEEGEEWMHCPISGCLIQDSRKRMRQYAKDMTYLTQYFRPQVRVRFTCRKVDPQESQAA